MIETYTVPGLISDPKENAQWKVYFQRELEYYTKKFSSPFTPFWRLDYYDRKIQFCETVLHCLEPATIYVGCFYEPQSIAL